MTGITPILHTIFCDIATPLAPFSSSFLGFTPSILLSRIASFFVFKNKFASEFRCSSNLDCQIAPCGYKGAMKALFG